ncbi:MAG: hypothetical protein JWM73_1543 [Solirubrobacterales bacterium]|nr:hypothetical protein [Solirubrobacterales bacterium]
MWLTHGRDDVLGREVPRSRTPDAEELLRTAFDHAPIGMSVVSPTGEWMRINDEFCRMLGYERDELLTVKCIALTHPDEHAADREYWAAVLAGERDKLERDKRYLHRDGTVRWMHVRSEVTRDADGAPLYSVSHLLDVTESRMSEGRLRDSERTLRSVIDNTPSVLYVKGPDLRYQLVNREFEELFGVDGTWVIGRTDGEFMEAGQASEQHDKEMLVLDGGVPVQDEEASTHDGRERVFLSTRFPLLDDDGLVIGLCGVSTDVSERRREETRRRERLLCSEQIHAALAQDRFVLHAQPIVNLATMQQEQSELLIRMRAGRGSDELLAPAAFLPAAERYDLIQMIDEWVVERAVALARRGHVVEVNLSAKTISDPDLVDRIEKSIIRSDAPPQHLIFEITETAVADNLDAARDFAVRLRGLGCAFALDDFGVGHGTFTYLRHLPVDYLKIDLQFVRDLMTDVASRHVVQAIVGVARQFDIQTIAEGVEEVTTLDKLREMGVDYAQGYLLGRPAPLALTDTPNHGDPHAVS